MRVLQTDPGSHSCLWDEPMNPSQASRSVNLSMFSFPHFKIPGFKTEGLDYLAHSFPI